MRTTEFCFFGKLLCKHFFRVQIVSTAQCCFCSERMCLHSWESIQMQICRALAAFSHDQINANHSDTGAGNWQTLWSKSILSWTGLNTIISYFQILTVTASARLLCQSLVVKRLGVCQTCILWRKISLSPPWAGGLCGNQPLHQRFSGLEAGQTFVCWLGTIGQCWFDRSLKVLARLGRPPFAFSTRPFSSSGESFVCAQE